MTVELRMSTETWEKRAVTLVSNYSSGSQIVPRGSLWISDRLPEDPCIHFCNGCFDVYLFFSSWNNVLLEIIQELL